MSPKATAALDAWHPHPADKTSQTDDQRIKDITVLPPPEHLIRFFPISGTPVEALITRTRHAIHDIMVGKDDRLVVIMGPCSIHDPSAALDYARRAVNAANCGSGMGATISTGCSSASRNALYHGSFASPTKCHLGTEVSHPSNSPAHAICTS